MHFVEQRFDDVLVLAFKGKLTGSPETEALHEKLTSYLDEKTKNIVLDLKHVHWISSMGIGAIMRCTMTVRTNGGDLRLTGLSDKVKNILSITQLVGVIHAYDSVKDAIDSFSDEENK
jgi:anti-sigma B factor antagonist